MRPFRSLVLPLTVLLLSPLCTAAQAQPRLEEAERARLAATATLPWTVPLTDIETLMRREMLDPTLLDHPGYAPVRAQLQALLAAGATRKGFVKGFNAAWRQGPSSHVRLQPAPHPAADMARLLDEMDAPPEAVSLRRDGDLAILRVDTLMGRNTEQALHAAFAALAQQPPRGLIVDLRHNEGGAFAVQPLVGHLLAQPHDSGVFVSRRWGGRPPPSREEVLQRPPWSGHSLRAFWHAVREQPFTRLRFEPMAPHYAGPVWLLSSARTASAAELAIDALVGAGRAQLVGERTAGQMLSQMPFDLADGLLLFVPVADYHAWSGGRLEGRGVPPQHPVAAENALEVALRLAGHAGHAGPAVPSPSSASTDRP